MEGADNTVSGPAVVRQRHLLMDEERTGRRGLTDQKQGRGGWNPASPPSTAIPPIPERAERGRSERAEVGEAEWAGRGGGWGPADAKSPLPASTTWSSRNWAGNEWRVPAADWAAGSWSTNAWASQGSQASHLWAAPSLNWSQAAPKVPKEPAWDGEPEIGEDGAARAVAVALGQLHLGSVRRVLAIGSGEAARGALVVASLAMPGSQCFVAPSTLEAEPAIRERLNADGRKSLVSQISIVNLEMVKAGHCGSLDLIVVIAGLRDSPAAAVAVPLVVGMLRPGGRLIIAIAAGPRPNAVAKIALSYATEHPDSGGDMARALTEAAVTFAPPCADPAQLHSSLEDSGLKVHHISRHAPAVAHTVAGVDSGAVPSPAEPMGFSCIDEFDKMHVNDRTVSIARSGITTTLNARTTVLTQNQLQAQLVQHLAAAWAGVPVGCAPPPGDRALFAHIARNCLGPDGLQAHNARVDEIVEAEAERVR